MLSLGVDVAARRGLDVVALDERRTVVHGPERLRDPEALGELARALEPDVVAVDAPPTWARPGQRSRAAERALMRLGISVYCTPAAEIAAGNPFYDWVLTGHRCFAELADVGWPVHDGPPDPVAGRSLEVFPHATAALLLGGVPPARSPKVPRRLAALAAAGVHEAEPSWGIDAIDGALCALTGLLAMEGRTAPVGEPGEGVLLLPAPLPEGRLPRLAPLTPGG